MGIGGFVGKTTYAIAVLTLELGRNAHSNVDDGRSEPVDSASHLASSQFPKRAFRSKLKQPADVDPPSGYQGTTTWYQYPSLAPDHDYESKEQDVQLVSK
eukprot:3683371-Amphidinium_carterae.4